MRLPRQWKTERETSLRSQVTSCEAFIAYGKWWVHCMFLLIERLRSLPSFPGREASDVFCTKDELCPHSIGFYWSWLRCICSRLKFWLTLCNGCFVAVGRIFLSWDIKPTLYKCGTVTLSDVVLYTQNIWFLKLSKLVEYTMLMSCSIVLPPFLHSEM